MKPKTLVLRTAGSNCDGETAYAFERAGSVPTLLHVNRLLEKPTQLREYQILAFPGGFSYGDDIAAGRIFANQIRHHLSDVIRDFVGAGKPVVGICNGFQVLVKTDLLPGATGGRGGQTATLTHNDSGRFVDRWVRLAPGSSSPHAKGAASRCVWTAGLGEVELPIAHGEGKFVPADEAVRASLWAGGQVALVYAPEPAGAGGGADEAYNFNGSTDDIAGVCDSTGLIFGLMPHPERHVDAIQHPAWSRRGDAGGEGQGLQIFRNAVRHVSQ